MPGRLTTRSTWVLIGALIALVGALALCLDRAHNGDFYLSLVSGRFIAHHGLASHDPFPTLSQGGTWLNQQWLSELAFFRVSEWLGPTGLTVLYACLITAPLALLLWLCRRKGWPMLFAVAAFYFPGVLAVIHPRAAGFTVLIFSLLVALLVVLWRERGGGRPAAAAPGWRRWRSWPCSRSGRTSTGASSRDSCCWRWPPSGSAIDHWRGIPGLPAALAGRRARDRRRPRRGDHHRGDAARFGDLVVSAQLPEPGDLAGEHRVGVRLQLARGADLPLAGRRRSPAGCGCARRGHGGSRRCW